VENSGERAADKQIVVVIRDRLSYLNSRRRKVGKRMRKSESPADDMSRLVMCWGVLAGGERENSADAATLSLSPHSLSLCSSTLSSLPLRFHTRTATP